MTDRCGRPRKNGAPCNAVRASQTMLSREYDPACWIHLTPAERAVKAAAVTAEAEATAAYLDSIYPACWSWPVPEIEDGWERFRAFHVNRCAICGHRASRLVEDHDHETGRYRGLLCPGCNASEGRSDLPVYERYRDRPPAQIVGFVETYEVQYQWDVSNIGGIALGTTQRYVEAAGTLDNSPAYALAAKIAPKETP